MNDRPNPDPLRHPVPGLGEFRINLDAFTTQGLNSWLSNLVAAGSPPDAPIIQTIQSEINRRSNPKETR
jgi:hypothetical protein